MCCLLPGGDVDRGPRDLGRHGPASLRRNAERYIKPSRDSGVIRKVILHLCPAKEMPKLWTNEDEVRLGAALASGKGALLEALVVQCLHLGPPQSAPLIQLGKVIAIEVPTDIAGSTPTMHDLNGELLKELTGGFTRAWTWDQATTRTEPPR